MKSKPKLSTFLGVPFFAGGTPFLERYQKLNFLTINVLAKQCQYIDPSHGLYSKIDYNETGQVLNKHLHSTDSVNFLQNIAYTYNERGWLLTSSAPLFALQLYYNSSTNKAYNGNIMYQYWGTPGSLTYNYTYTYDKLNRLGSGKSADFYNEQAIAYDQTGNLTALQRYSAGTLIDNLAYTYTSGGNPTNQLQNIVDASGSNTGLMNGTTSYIYDGNGNELSAANTVNTAQNKSFSYNLLNLPQVATVPTGTLTYTYDAAGNKLRRVNTVTHNTTDYISGIQYDGATTPALSFIQTEEGKAVVNGTSYDYTYYLGDNLGNTRITFDTKTGVAVQQQKDDYYPFGLEINRNVLSPKNEYLYNKKELQEELTEYDYGARFYDPVIARWTSVDPLAEKSRRFSPYNYVENDPIRLTDPDGMVCSPCDVGQDPSSPTHYTKNANGDLQANAQLNGVSIHPDSYAQGPHAEVGDGSASAGLFRTGFNENGNKCESRVKI